MKELNLVCYHQQPLNRIILSMKEVCSPKEELYQ